MSHLIITLEKLKQLKPQTLPVRATPGSVTLLMTILAKIILQYSFRYHYLVHLLSFELFVILSFQYLFYKNASFF